MTDVVHLPAFDEETQDLNVVIETAKGSRNKFKFNEKYGLYQLGGVLPLGSVFPYDFGFVPSTLGEDGDPIDVLLLMDEAAFPGCWLQARLIGVIEAEQTERDGKTERNDRLVAVASVAHTYRDVQALDDLNGTLLEEIEHFFVSYNEERGKRFEPIGRHGPEHARKLVEEGIRRAS